MRMDSTNNPSGASFTPGLCAPDGRLLRLIPVDAPIRRHYRDSPCLVCALRFLHEADGATGTPADCRPWVRCMAHERPDRRSVVFIEPDAGALAR